MKNIKEILEVQGFKENDRVRYGVKNITTGKKAKNTPHKKRWNQYSKTVKEVIEDLSVLHKGCNYYISNAIHTGGKLFTEEDFSSVVEIVIDIDYGPFHKTPPQYDTHDEALEVAQKLPKPTLIVHSGGGIQVHYRLTSRARHKDELQIAKKVSKAMRRLVRGDGCESHGHVFRLACTKNNRENAPVRDVEIDGCNPDVDYRVEDLKKWCLDQGIYNDQNSLSVKPQNKKPKNKKKKKRRKLPSEDRSRKIFVEIEKILRNNPGYEDRRIMAILKKKAIYSHFTEKGEKADQYALADIRQIRRKLTKDKRPAPPNKVENIKYQSPPSQDLLAMLETFNKKVYDTKGTNVVKSLALIEKLYKDKKQAILNFPCASGKTTAAMILAAQHASKENRIWIVTQKVQDVCSIASRLRKLDCNAIEWHGRPGYCPTDREKFIGKGRGHFCKSCEVACTARNKYFSNDQCDDEKYDVLVTTHSHWQHTIATGSFKESVKYVIVDEAPTSMEYFYLDKDRIDKIKYVFKFSHSLSKSFDTGMNYLYDILSEGDCLKIDPPTVLRKMDDINRCLFKLLEKEEITPDTYELVKLFLHFFMNTEIYGILEYPGGKFKMTFIGGTVDLRTTIPHIVLDGSALMNDVNWEGFTIYQSPDLKQEYPNTTVNILNGNPSKVFLSDEKNFTELSEKIFNSIEENSHITEEGNSVIIFQNKELSNDLKLQKNIEQLDLDLRNCNINVVNMCRGEHIGSNNGRDAVMCAITMGLFNPISYYVLRTALTTHKEIYADRIWAIKFNSPRMKKTGGFSDYFIQQTYCRALVIDVYQAIMRGCVRKNSEANYDVVCVISGLDSISILQEELSGAKFNYADAEIIEAIYAGKPDSEIIKLMSGLNRTSKYEKLKKIKYNLGMGNITVHVDK